MPTRLFRRTPAGHGDRFLALHGAEARPLTTLGIGRAALSVSPAGFEVSSPSRLTHKLVVTLEGEGFLESGAVRVRLAPGTVAFCPAGRECRYGVRTGPWRRVWFDLANTPRWAPTARRGVTCEPAKPSNLPASVERAVEGFLAEAEPVAPTPPPGLAPDAARLLLLLPDRQGWALPVPPSPLRSETSAAELYARLIRGCVHRALGITDQPGGEQFGTRLDQLWGRVRATLHEDWSVERLAAAIHVSPATFYRMTRSRYAMTPGALLSQLKLEQARRLLVLTDEPLKQIAARLGYANPFAFTNAFKAKTGVSPQRFREQAGLGGGAGK